MFAYLEEVCFVDFQGNIQKAKFSEYWDDGFSYINQGNKSFQVRTELIFSQELECLLYLLKQKENQINGIKRTIEKLPQYLEKLEKEFKKIQNNINTQELI